MADKFLRCEVVGSIANSITVKPYVDGAGIITVCQQNNILFDPETLRAEGAEEMRQAALNALARTAREKFNLSDEYNHYLAGLMDGELAIKALPTIQPEPQEGEWINTNPEYKNGFYNNSYYCSECHDYYTTSPYEMKFCPNCGAKMTISTK